MREWCALLVLLVLGGCAGSDSGGGTASMTMTVHPGESIQAAVTAAPPNTTIFVEPGVYHESTGAPSAVVISQDGLQLIGLRT